MTSGETAHSGPLSGLGSVERMVLAHLAGLAETVPRDSIRLTPYRIAKDLGLLPSSVTGACRSLARKRLVTQYGSSPLIVGPAT